MEIKNALIHSVRLSTEDYGCLVGWLNLEYEGSSGQSFGGYNLYNIGTRDQDNKGCAGLFLSRCIKIGGVDTWEALPGRTIRVRCTRRNVEAIGHIIEEDWFTPKEDIG